MTMILKVAQQQEDHTQPVKEKKGKTKKTFKI